MMIPILRALRSALPDSYICVAATRINSEAIASCPYLNKIEILDLDNPVNFLRDIFRLRKEGFDLSIDFEQRIKISALISYFTGSRQRIGFRTKGYYRHYLYTIKVHHRRDWHEFWCMAELLKGIAPKITDSHPEFWISDEDKKWADEFVYKHSLSGKRIIVLHPGCGIRYLKGARAREWPKENFAVLGDILTRTYNAQIIITGGRDEIGLAQEIYGLMKIKPLILSSRLNIGRLAAILVRSALFISGDTGIMHLASALGVNTLSIFGPSDEKRWVPLGSKSKIVLNEQCRCRPCQLFGIDKPKCNKYKCIRP